MMSLRITRRRLRHPDLLASPRAVRYLLDELRESLPDITPQGEKLLLHMLQAARHVDLSDELLEEFLRASEPLWAVVAKIERRRQPARQEKLDVRSCL